MRNNIALYLQEGLDGKFFYRMVDTVLSRDKNWVRWKLESCPQITGPSVEAEEHSRAQKELAKAFAKKRLRAAPLGSLDLSFLSDAEGSKVLEGLKKTQR